jgi:hypothetical protein
VRSDRDFTAEYREALAAVDPSTRHEIDADQARVLAQTELCLTYLHRFLPYDPVSSVPFLMMGYPKLLDGAGSEAAVSALMTLRHLCARFASVAAWVDATVNYSRTPEIIRCYELSGQRVVLRNAASDKIRSLLTSCLGTKVPWAVRKLTIATPGDATVIADRGRRKLSYSIPAVPAGRMMTAQHALAQRKTNPSIRIAFDDLLLIARQVDDLESRPGWPAESLPPLSLVGRLEKLRPKGLSGFFDGNTFTFEGATHVVGMLSSGKSTLVMAVLFGLTLGGSGKRIAILVNDTIQGAMVAARLRRHGVKASVLSSLPNRPKHLHGMHWQRGLDSTGWSLASLGDISEGFSTACPLDGSQKDLELVEGEPSDGWPYPDFSEKQCHRLYQRTPPDGRDDESLDDVDETARTQSCPLWACCPAQEQQRSAADAQVLIMTPQAFVHVTPDKWTTEHHLTIPELLQYDFDLVIVDEVDSVQKALDDVLAPRSPIMGDERNVYAPSIGLRSSEALRERSGVQFRKPINAKWQSNFFAFFRLIGTIYAILQNERDGLRSFYENTPFTAGSILYDLWRRRSFVLGRSSDDLTFDNPEFEREFLEVIKVTSAIKCYSRGSSIAEDDRDGENGVGGPVFEDKRFQDAAEALCEIARQMLVTDYYDVIVADVMEKLDGPLTVFNAVREDGPRGDRINRRDNALALMLATVADLALVHYNWLIRGQSAVARDFQIDESHLLGQSSNLLKHYRTLLPSNPAGAAFGLFYDEPPNEQRPAMGGKLTLISHLGVGRHLLTHLHDLLAAEGQAGPHVLMLSGTSWAGGSNRRKLPGTQKIIDAASPTFDVQVPVRGVLIQPKSELDAIEHSSFSLVSVRDQDGEQIRVSGKNQADRRKNLAAIAEHFAARRDGLNRFEDDWRKMTAKWAAWNLTAIDDRRRALLVTNSYADAAVVADTLLGALEANGYSDWRVHCLVRDRVDEGSADLDVRLTRARSLPRSLIERFGREPEKSVLVAPMQIVARGHNILNRARTAGISTIYFLHRPHPRPDDLGPTIGRVNRFAQERFDRGVKPKAGESFAGRARRVRFAATNIVRYGLEAGRFGYRSLPPEFKAQFAWDMLTQLWQTVGRGIRGGCPVFVGFVDYAFAPLSFDGNNSGDTPNSSALVQSLRQLELAMDTLENPSEHEVATLLYKPFYDALVRTEGLKHDQ